MELEIVEEYLLLGERRFRVRVKGTRVYVNVAASSPEEALEKAKVILDRLKAEKVLEYEGE